MERESPNDWGRLVRISVDPVTLEGNLGIPEYAAGIVLFAPGSGGSRFSPRNQFVADILRKGGLATLLLDLLTSKEEDIDLYTRHLRFDIDLLASRLVGATDWILEHSQTQNLKIGYFGSNAGVAAALVAATRRPGTVGAIVSRGGRPDLAGDALRNVESPTLLIVGGNDEQVLDLNSQALAQLRGKKKLEIVSGANHLFQESGALETVAQLAQEWFEQHLV
jgi:pimeloyl-ACP methyl ester carboxylesterase